MIFFKNQYKESIDYFFKKKHTPMDMSIYAREHGYC